MATTNNNQPKQPTVYNGMYAAIKQQAQSPSQVVKSFYSAAMSLEDGRYKQIFEELLGKSKGGFCSNYLPKVQEAFKAQDRHKHISLFFIWRVVYKDIKPMLEASKKVAKACASSIDSAREQAQAIDALQTMAEGDKKTSKKNNK